MLSMARDMKKGYVAQFSPAPGREMPVGDFCLPEVAWPVSDLKPRSGRIVGDSENGLSLLGDGRPKLGPQGSTFDAPIREGTNEIRITLPTGGARTQSR